MWPWKEFPAYQVAELRMTSFLEPSESSGPGALRDGGLSPSSPSSPAPALPGQLLRASLAPLGPPPSFSTPLSVRGVSQSVPSLLSLFWQLPGTRRARSQLQKTQRDLALPHSPSVLRASHGCPRCSSLCLAWGGLCLPQRLHACASLSSGLGTKATSPESPPGSPCEQLFPPRQPSLCLPVSPHLGPSRHPEFPLDLLPDCCLSSALPLEQTINSTETGPWFCSMWAPSTLPGAQRTPDKHLSNDMGTNGLSSLRCQGLCPGPSWS